ncbi:MAG TPA: SpvB/TcaC N-terminal domain-containing protein [Streptosporangiaceae bacterium]
MSLPKAGGAVRGLSEKFSVNAANGTASLSVPLPMSPGRNGFTPQLALSYDSGAGNGPFGMGWSLDLPAITRRTDKGLPHYRDADESDVFVLAGAEDLVPELDAAGAPVPQGGGGHDAVAQHAGGLSAAQQVGVVDAVPTRQHRMHQGQQLPAGMGGAGPLAQVDQRIGGLLDAQPLGQRGRQQQTRVGDGVGVVEADVELVQGVGRSHRESALLIGEHGSSGRRHSPRSEGLSHNSDRHHSITETVHSGSGDG